MTIEQLEEELDLLFDEMSDDDVISIHNNYCQSVGYDDYIYDMDDFDDEVKSRNYEPSELIYAVSGSDFDLNEAYFTFSDDGMEIRSFNDLLSAASPLDRETLINAIIDNREDYGDTDVSDLLEQLEEEE